MKKLSQRTKMNIQVAAKVALDAASVVVALINPIHPLLIAGALIALNHLVEWLFKRRE